MRDKPIVMYTEEQIEAINEGFVRAAGVAKAAAEEFAEAWNRVREKVNQNPPFGPPKEEK